MIMATVTMKLIIAPTILSMGKFRTRVPLAMRRAVRTGAAVALGKIVDRARVDTGRYRAVWSGAGKELGVAVPRQSVFPSNPRYYGSPPRDVNFTQSEFSEQTGPNRVAVQMRNNVPYGIFLEAKDQ